MTETGSLDRAKAALERRKLKTTLNSYGNMTNSVTGAETDSQVRSTHFSPSILQIRLILLIFFSHTERTRKRKSGKH